MSTETARRRVAVGMEQRLGATQLGQLSVSIKIDILKKGESVYSDDGATCETICFSHDFDCEITSISL